MVQLLLKETYMQYKTIVLEFFKESHPDAHDRLQRDRKLLRTINAYAVDLKAKHKAWMNALRSTEMVTHPSQLSGTALELALEDLQNSLQHEFGTDESEPLSLDAAMAFIRRHAPVG
jgi:hypothetical protein